MSRPYHSSFFACCSPCGLCMKACCCPCVVFGKNHYRSSHGTENGYSTMNGPCVGWCALGALGGWGWILQCLDRSENNAKYNLEGGGCGNCCKSFCCSCCELIQTHKELDYIQVSQNDQAHLGGYQKQAPMIPSQPNPQQPPQAYGAPQQHHA